MIQIEHHPDGYLVCRASGLLGKADYQTALPHLLNAIDTAGRPLRLMIRLEGFRGWDLAGLWEELKFDVAHASDFDRVAVVGESALEEWGTRLSSPFFGAAVRYFDHGAVKAAQDWLAAPAEPGER